MTSPEPSDIKNKDYIWWPARTWSEQAKMVRVRAYTQRGRQAEKRYAWKSSNLSYLNIKPPSATKSSLKTGQHNLNLPDGY